jgi:hypothetical protein
MSNFIPLYAPPHGISDYDDFVVNDSMGTTHLADTMDTEPDDDPEAGGKGIGPRAAE